MVTRVVLHVDFDYFYAQCEEIRSPSLKSKPVCVCVFSDRGNEAGAIATANYIAREYGVKSGMPVASAKRRLAERDDSVFLPVDFDYYSGMTEKAMAVMREDADIFEYVGRDEAYLDITNRVGGSFDLAAHAAQHLKNTLATGARIKCSVGVSPNKMLSKIASDFDKPDGLTVVRPEMIDQFIAPLKIRAIPGIGQKIGDRLTAMGFGTVGELKRLDVFALQKEFGRKIGTYIYNAARGMDGEPVRERAPSVQYSRIVTMPRNSRDYQILSKVLAGLCGDVHDTAMRNSKSFRSVGVHFVQSDMSARSKSRMLRAPTSNLGDLCRAADRLLAEALEDQKIGIRRLGIRISEFSEIRDQRDITDYF